MVTAEARIETSRPERYLTQICKHAAAIGGEAHRAGMHHGGPSHADPGHVASEWSEHRGTVTFTPWGTCVITADGGVLSLRIEASDEESLRRIQAILTRDLDR